MLFCGGRSDSMYQYGINRNISCDLLPNNLPYTIFSPGRNLTEGEYWRVDGVVFMCEIHCRIGLSAHTWARTVLTAVFSKWCPTVFTQQDLKSVNLSLNEAIDMAQNRPLWKMMYTFGAVVHARNEWMNDCVCRTTANLSLMWFIVVVMSCLQIF